jgi:hypothetical protein
MRSEARPEAAGHLAEQEAPKARLERQRGQQVDGDRRGQTTDDEPERVPRRMLAQVGLEELELIGRHPGPLERDVLLDGVDGLHPAQQPAEPEPPPARAALE